MSDNWMASSPFASWLLLQQTERLILQYVGTRIAHHGLSVAQARALIVLGQAGHPVSLSRLARQLVQEPQSMTALADQLEGLGLIRRVQDQRDRRVVNVAPTVKGAALLEHVGPAMFEALSEAFAALPSNEFDTLLRDLRTLRDHTADLMHLGAAWFEVARVRGTAAEVDTC